MPRDISDLIKPDAMLVNHAKMDMYSKHPPILAFVQNQHVIATKITTQLPISVMIVELTDGVKMQSVESKLTNAELPHHELIATTKV
jgi:hypothetical protein